MTALLSALAGGGVVGLFTIAGVYVTHRFEARREADRRADAAYARLATAVVVFQMRVDSWRNDRSFHVSLAESMQAMTQLTMFLLFLLIPKRFRPRNLDAMELAKLIRGPEYRLGIDQSYPALLNALEAVLTATTEVQIAGKAIVHEAAIHVTDSCVAFAAAARKPVLPWNARQRADDVSARRASLHEVTQAYVSAVRDAGSSVRIDR